MATQHRRTLENDTVVNVAQLLKEPIGATRLVAVRLETFPLTEDVTSHDFEAKVRLTRVTGGLLADGELHGTARLTCVRCLEEYDQPFAGAFDDAEFRQSVDVRSGLPLPLPEDEEIFVIDHNHELDLAEVLRQVAIIELPMQPVCREDCPGIPLAEPAGETADEESDQRLQVLGKLLGERE